MDFPEATRIGATAETLATLLFQEWGWAVGKYQPDPGYDLTVMPPAGEFLGKSFLVQVKGTARKKGARAMVAPVKKMRLRQYAQAADPVFIVRVAADRTLYWVHAQSWCRTHAHRLEGSGESGVKMDAQDVLTDREAFARVLRAAFEEASPRVRLDLSSRSGLFPTGLRPPAPTGDLTEFLPGAKTTELEVIFKPTPTAHNLANLEEAINFGLPRQVEIDDLQVRSDALGHAALLPKGASSVSVSVPPTECGELYLYPGARRLVTVTPLRLSVNLFHGSKGFSISTDGKPGALDMSLVFPRDPPSNDVDMKMGFRLAELSARPLREWDDLGVMATWADQVLIHEALRAEAAFPRGRLVLEAKGTGVRNVQGKIVAVRALGRLHLIARALDSNYVLSTSATLDDETLGDIDFAFALLEGRRLPVTVGDFELNPTADLQVDGPQLLVLTHDLPLNIQGDAVGEIPIAIELCNFKFDRTAASGKLRVVKSDDSEAWIYLPTPEEMATRTEGSSGGSPA